MALSDSCIRYRRACMTKVLNVDGARDVCLDSNGKEAFHALLSFPSTEGMKRDV